jgi:hypothetical protein
MYLLKHQPHREEGVEIGPVTGVEMQSLGGGMYLNSDTLKYKLSLLTR